MLLKLKTVTNKISNTLHVCSREFQQFIETTTISMKWSIKNQLFGTCLESKKQTAMHW